MDPDRSPLIGVAFNVVDGCVIVVRVADANRVTSLCPDRPGKVVSDPIRGELLCLSDERLGIARSDPDKRVSVHAGDCDDA